MTSKFLDLLCGSDLAAHDLARCKDPQPRFSTAIFTFLYDWQTLLTGLLAVIAAGIGGYLLWVQISDQRKELERQRRRESLAARIQLPHALAELSLHWHACFDAWTKKDPDARPKMPFGALQTVMTAAVLVDDESFRSLQELTMFSQAFESRLSSTRPKRPLNVLDTMIADIARLSYLTTRLFEFGRMEVETFPYLKPARADFEEILDREFGIRFLPESDEMRARVKRALDMHFPKTRGS